MTISPIKAYDPETDKGETQWFRVTTDWRKLTKGWGRGRAQYASFLSSRGGSFWADSKHTYNVESQVFTYTIVTDRKLHVYLVSGSAVTTKSGQLVLDANSANIGKLGSAGKDSVK